MGLAPRSWARWVQVRPVLEYVEGEPITEEAVAIARVIADVWLAALVSWVTGRGTAEDVSARVEMAVHLLLR